MNKIAHIILFNRFRSPSPEPIYDQQGKRQNTREVRTRRKIEEQRHRFVTELLALNPEYKAPADYKYVLHCEVLSLIFSGKEHKIVFFSIFQVIANY